ncbi:MAG: lmo0937 family membrane protein [Candidatus Angelobacter sp.]
MRLAWAIVAVLLILWLLGLGLHLAGSLIHLLLVVAIFVLLIDLLRGRRSVV